MQVKNTLIKLVVIAAVMIPYASAAQTSSINAFSPYTMYGIGEQNTCLLYTSPSPRDTR